MTVFFDGTPKTIEDIVAIADGGNSALSSDTSYIGKINKGSDFLDRALQKHGGIYGVTTGYGDSCGKTVAPENYYDLPVHLTRFHGCGMGRYFDLNTTRAIIATRLQSLSIGYSGVSYELLAALQNLLKNEIFPLIPEEGSVGASGDLTPLSYIAGTLIGERDVLYKKQRRPAKDVYQELGLSLHRLRPKEALAIMNGTAVMTAIACMAFKRAEYLAELATKITSIASVALMGNAYHFDEKLFSVKPHQGQNSVARRIRNDLGHKSEKGVIPHRIQDPYSIRCAPHIIGVFYDAAPMFRSIIENELNSANDNPIIDPESESIMHGGHFYGGHIAFVMDSLKNIIANLCDLMDRQLAVLVDEKFNRGLPPNLSGVQSAFAHNHGFKAVQIAVSAWTAEALKNTMPASVFSRSTECHNQDKVSMGTIAARDCIRNLELAEQVGAACLLASVQALELRYASQGIAHEHKQGLQGLVDQVRKVSPVLREDRPLEAELRMVVDLIRNRHWELSYE